MGDEEEVLHHGRPPVPRRIRLAALLLAVLAVAALVAVRVWPRSTPPSGAPPGTRSVAPFPVGSPETTRTLPSWPTAAGACDPAVRIPLPIVSSTPSSGHTGIQVLLGGPQLRTVDFDSGRVTAIAKPRLRPGEFVRDLFVASQTYAVTGRCKGTSSRVLRVGTDGNLSIITPPGSIEGVLADGARVWGVSWPKTPTARGYLLPIDGGPRVRLPAGFDPFAIVTGVVVGWRHETPEPTDRDPLLLVDASTGRVRAELGKGWPLAAGNGLVLWTIGCDAVSDTPCTFHRTSITGGPTASYRLPRPAFEGVVSPNGQLIALTLERPAQDLRFEGDIPPADIAILHLDTGRVEIVPGIEIHAKTSPGLAFSADSRWLVIALDAGPQTRLLAWRSGLTHPYESQPIAGPTRDPPPILVLPARTEHDAQLTYLY